MTACSGHTEDGPPTAAHLSEAGKPHLPGAGWPRAHETQEPHIFLRPDGRAPHDVPP